MRLAKWFRWVFPAKNKTNESINIVNSIAKTKKLHKELILYAFAFCYIFISRQGLKCLNYLFYTSNF